jgi:hypothetical protein
LSRHGFIVLIDEPHEQAAQPAQGSVSADWTPAGRLLRRENRLRSAQSRAI